MVCLEKNNKEKVSSEEILCLNSFNRGFIETESEEHFRLRCPHIDRKTQNNTVNSETIASV